MQALALSLTLCALQLWPAALGGPQHQRFVVLEKDRPMKLSKLQRFEWANCGPPSNPAVIRSLSVSPDPISIPGDVTVSASAATSVNLVSPLMGNVTLEKRLGEMWLKIPCVDNIGSCTYDDVCVILDSIAPPGQPCPEPLQTYGIPCRCPFRAGTYNLPPVGIFIPNVELPPFFTNGDYRLKVVLSYGGQQLSCSKLLFSLRAN
ncbi:ganglioside GM2 activator [Elgaria multicarinata webbii]|uniref:ganglioside GM2 activator n=1 Tax=Elgaria multicarinata webbii TaxID=159646 RepID=UPI002FCD5B8F